MRLLHLLAGTALVLAGPALAQTVTVQPGDTLSIIARTQLGDVSRWRDICAANRAIIGENCNAIRPGMRLALPGPDFVAPAATAPAEEAEETASAPAPRVEEPQVEETPAAPAAEDDTRSDINPANIEGGEIVYNFAAIPDIVFTAEAPFDVVRLEGADFVRLSGAVENAPSGGRPGIWMQLDSAFEQAASGRTIQIDALVRLDVPGSFAMSYSTSEGGNSGWQTLDAVDAFGTISFTYDVPEVDTRRGDYLGILPDPDGTGQVLDISFIAVTVVE